MAKRIIQSAGNSEVVAVLLVKKWQKSLVLPIMIKK